MPRSKAQTKLDAKNKQLHAEAVARKRQEQKAQEQEAFDKTRRGQAVAGIKSGGKAIARGAGALAQGAQSGGKALAKGVSAAAARIGSVFKPTAKGYTSEIKLRL